MKHIAILGSTGSIGVQTLEVVRASQGEIKVVALAAGQNVNLLAEQIAEFKPQIVSVGSSQLVKNISEKFPNIKVFSGEQGLNQCALSSADTVVISIVGVAALKPTLAAIKAKKDIALASKEILVAAGGLVMGEVAKYGVKLLPVDSEHSAIMQSCPPEVTAAGSFRYPTESIEKLIITASGGAFRDVESSALKYKTCKEALKHPNWTMGKKITIDSATLMNKGLEIIEAHWLFGVPYEKIEAVIHPQSIIHSLVEYVDGSLIAQLGQPDMRIPIQYALYYPERRFAVWPKLRLTDLEKLTFKKPDLDKFRALAIAYQAGRAGGTMPAVLNAANEAAVSLFSNDLIGFLEIANIVERILNKHQNIFNPSLEEIIQADLWARNEVEIMFKTTAGKL